MAKEQKNQNLLIIAIVGIVAIVALMVFNGSATGRSNMGFIAGTDGFYRNGISIYDAGGYEQPVPMFDTKCLDEKCKEQCKSCDWDHPFKTCGDCKICGKANCPVTASNGLSVYNTI